jgi:hypothetical protein
MNTGKILTHMIVGMHAHTRMHVRTEEQSLEMDLVSNL